MLAVAQVLGRALPGQAPKHTQGTRMIQHGSLLVLHNPGNGVWFVTESTCHWREFEGSSPFHICQPCIICSSRPTVFLGFDRAVESNPLSLGRIPGTSWAFENPMEGSWRRYKCDVHRTGPGGTGGLETRGLHPRAKVRLEESKRKRDLTQSAPNPRKTQQEHMTTTCILPFYALQIFNLQREREFVFSISSLSLTLQKTAAIMGASG